MVVLFLHCEVKNGTKVTRRVETLMIFANINFSTKFIGSFLIRFLLILKMWTNNKKEKDFFEVRLFYLFNAYPVKRLLTLTAFICILV